MECTSGSHILFVAEPKSQIINVDPLSRMFSIFKSRWIIWFGVKLCIVSTPRIIWERVRRIWGGLQSGVLLVVILWKVFKTYESVVFEATALLRTFNKLDLQNGVSEIISVMSEVSLFIW